MLSIIISSALWAPTLLPAKLCFVFLRGMSDEVTSVQPKIIEARRIAQSELIDGKAVSSVGLRDKDYFLTQSGAKVIRYDSSGRIVSQIDTLPGFRLVASQGEKLVFASEESLAFSSWNSPIASVARVRGVEGLGGVGPSKSQPFIFSPNGNFGVLGNRTEELSYRDVFAAYDLSGTTVVLSDARNSDGFGRRVFFDPSDSNRVMVVGSQGVSVWKFLTGAETVSIPEGQLIQFPVGLRVNDAALGPDGVTLVLNVDASDQFNGRGPLSHLVYRINWSSPKATLVDRIFGLKTYGSFPIIPISDRRYLTFNDKRVSIVRGASRNPVVRLAQRMFPRVALVWEMQNSVTSRVNEMIQNVYEFPNTSLIAIVTNLGLRLWNPYTGDETFLKPIVQGSEVRLNGKAEFFWNGDKLSAILGTREEGLGYLGENPGEDVTIHRIAGKEFVFSIPGYIHMEVSKDQLPQ